MVLISNVNFSVIQRDEFEVVDMFSIEQSTHVECVCLLSRK